MHTMLFLVENLVYATKPLYYKYISLYICSTGQILKLLRYDKIIF